MFLTFLHKGQSPHILVHTDFNKFCVRILSRLIGKERIFTRLGARFRCARNSRLLQDWENQARFDEL